MKNILVSSAQRWLTVLWFVSFCFIMAVVTIWAVGNFFRQNGMVDNIWNWVLQYLYPNVALIFTTFVVVRREQDKEKEIDIFFYRISLAVSTVYILMLLGIMLALAIAENQAKDCEQILKSTKPILSTLQGILSSVLGMFFIKQNAQKSRQSNSKIKKVP